MSDALVSVSRDFHRSIDVLLTFASQIHFLLLVSRQGKVRLNKWYSIYSQKEKAKIQREARPNQSCGRSPLTPQVTNMVLNRPPKLCNFIEWKEQKIIYKRYESALHEVHASRVLDALYPSA